MKVKRMVMPLSVLCLPICILCLASSVLALEMPFMLLPRVSGDLSYDQESIIYVHAILAQTNVTAYNVTWMTAPLDTRMISPSDVCREPESIVASRDSLRLKIVVTVQCGKFSCDWVVDTMTRVFPLCPSQLLKNSVVTSSASEATVPVTLIFFLIALLLSLM